MSWCDRVSAGYVDSAGMDHSTNFFGSAADRSMIQKYREILCLMLTTNEGFHVPTKFKQTNIERKDTVGYG